jgi:hypothetical protein
MSFFLKDVCSYYQYLTYKLDVSKAEAALICSNLRSLSDAYDLVELEDVFKISSYEYTSSIYKGLRLFKSKVEMEDVLEMYEFNSYVDYLKASGAISTTCIEILAGIIDEGNSNGIVNVSYQATNIEKDGVMVDFEDELESILAGFKSEDSSRMTVIDEDKTVGVVSALLGLGKDEFIGRDMDTQEEVLLSSGHLKKSLESGNIDPKNFEEALICRAVLIDNIDRIPIISRVVDTTSDNFVYDRRVLSLFKALDLGSLGFDYYKLVSPYEKLSVHSKGYVSGPWDPSKERERFMNAYRGDCFGDMVSYRVMDAWLHEKKNGLLPFLKKCNLKYVGGNRNSWNWIVTYIGEVRSITGDDLEFLIRLVPKIYSLAIIHAAKLEKIEDKPDVFLKGVCLTYYLSEWYESINLILGDLIKVDNKYRASLGYHLVGTGSTRQLIDPRRLGELRFYEDKEFDGLSLGSNMINYRNNKRKKKLLINHKLKVKPRKVIDNDINTMPDKSSLYVGAMVIFRSITKLRESGIKCDMTDRTITTFSNVIWTAGTLSFVLGLTGSGYIFTNKARIKNLLIIQDSIMFNWIGDPVYRLVKNDFFKCQWNYGYYIYLGGDIKCMEIDDIKSITVKQDYKCREDIELGTLQGESYIKFLRYLGDSEVRIKPKPSLLSGRLKVLDDLSKN